MPVIGLDLGGTKLASAIFNTEGKILYKESIPLEKRKGKEVGVLIQNQIKKIFELSEKNNYKIESIGACVPGISYHKTGKVWAPNIPGWDDYPLFDDLTSAVNNRDVVIKIDSDRACYILGEVWQGSAKGCKDAIFLAVGTGIGAGILVNGEVLRGSNDIAGAIGWLALDRPFVDMYISCGCFEYHASGEGISKVAKDYLAEVKNYKGKLCAKNIEDITAHDVFESYKEKDPVAQMVLKQAVEFWGMTAANLVSLFNPEKIIWGGGVFGPALQFLDNIMTEAKKWAQPISIKQVSFEGSKLGSDAGLYGAGYLALKQK
jgi:glucokinase